MNRHKLVQIILKDLEELKILSEEVAEYQNDATLIIDLALNKARLLCQEIELLHELSGEPDTFQEENRKDPIDEDEDEVSDVSFSDPEFEILNFEEQEFPENEELAEEEEGVLEDEANDDEVQEDESGQENLDKDKPELNEDEADDDDLSEEDEDDQDENDEENPDEDDELVESEEDEDEESDEDEEDDQPENEDVDLNEEPQQKKNIQIIELKDDPQHGVREIHMDDLDDDELESIQFSPLSSTSGRTVMREIPKPENPVHEKLVVGESFQKERSLNDVMSETKSGESKLTNGPITSLRAAIGLNDRFFFIREIFENNTEKYNMIIDKLDKLETIQQAVEYLKANLSLQKNDTSLKFVDLLKRRFSK